MIHVKTLGGTTIELNPDAVDIIEAMDDLACRATMRTGVAFTLPYSQREFVFEVRQAQQYPNSVVAMDAHGNIMRNREWHERIEAERRSATEAAKKPLDDTVTAE